MLGGIGFTAEHDLHHHVKRVLVLDGLLGSSRELTEESRSGAAGPRLGPASPTSSRSRERRVCTQHAAHFCVARGVDYLMLAFISSRFTSTGHPPTLSALPWPVWWMSNTDWIAA